MDLTSIDSFLAYWTKMHERTRRVIASIPPEHLEWSYREGKFTFGDLIRHLALLERHMFAENVTGMASRYRGCGREHADGYPAVLELFERLDQETVAILRSLPESRLREHCVTPGGAKILVWKWLRAMVEHHAHHRGQIYLMLGLLDVETPPLYGLTSEEVARRGAS
jgi:uncharacterized damage-inducible protein DinB